MNEKGDVLMAAAALTILTIRPPDEAFVVAEQNLSLPRWKPVRYGLRKLRLQDTYLYSPAVMPSVTAIANRCGGARILGYGKATF